MKIACLSDLHIDCVADPASIEVAQAAFQAATVAGADHVVVAGDLFDSAAAMLRDGGLMKALLKDAGLWHPERLTIVPGNHDVYHLGHRGGRLGMALGLLRTLQCDGRENLRAFEAWMDELVPEQGRAKTGGLFPFLKTVGGVSLLACNTVGPNTALSISGWWPERGERVARALLGEAQCRRLLVAHHPPEISPPSGGVAFGFTTEAFARLENFADDLALEAVVCGHVHETGGGPWNWQLGKGTAVHLVGRTGGMHGTERCLVMLEALEVGDMRATTVAF